MNKVQKSLMKLVGIEFPKEVTETTEKWIGGGFLDLGTKRLSDEKSVSTKLVQAYLGWVYINSSVLAEAVSKIELKLYQTNYKGGELVLSEIQQHELLDLLDRFNESTTSSDGFYLTETYLNLVGDGFWYTPLKNGKPTDIFILRPDKINVNLGDFTASSRRLIDSYEYKDTVDGKDVSITYPVDEIMHVKVPNPANPYRGKSTVEAVANDIDMDSFAGLTLREFFENGMIVQFALTTDQKLTKDQIASFQAQLRSVYGGARNAWKVPIFGGNLQPKELQMTSKDMELIAQMEWLRDKIMIAFKNTPASIGVIEDVNRSNSESTLANWKASVIKPKMQRIVDAINEYIVPKYGNNLILGFEDPSPDDDAQETKNAIELYKAGIITKNEAREMAEFDAVQGGDDFQTVPTAFGQLPKDVANVNYKAIFRRNGITKEFESYKKFFNEQLPKARKTLKSKVKQEEPIVVTRPKYSYDVNTVDKYAAEQLKIVDHHEQIFKNAVTQVLSGVVEEGLNNFTSSTARKKNQLVDKEKWINEGINKLTPILDQVVIQAGNQANRLIGVDNPYIPKAMKEVDVKKFIKQQIQLFMDSAIDTDVDVMVGLIAAGLDDEKSVPEIKRDIIDKFSDYTPNQAEKITRTEVIKTSNLGAQDAFEQSGVVEGKQWLATEDDRTDEECSALDGKIIDLTDNFFVKGDKFMGITLDYQDVGYPPLHPNCRCVILPVLVGEKAVVSITDKETLKENKDLKERIKELEADIDKRKKEFRQLRSDNIDDKAYIKALEHYREVKPKKETPEKS